MDERATWEHNSVEGWSIGPSFNHYRCIKCYFPNTRCERDCDTITFIPHAIPFPQVTIDYFLRQATNDIISILTKSHNLSIPTMEAGDKTRNAILKLATLLNKVDDLPTLPPKNPSSHDSNVRVSKSTLGTTVSEPRVSNPTLSEPRVRPNKSLNWRRGELNIPHTRYNLRFTSSGSYQSRAAQYLFAQHICSTHFVHHIYKDTGICLKVDDLLQGKHGADRLIPAMSNE